MNSRFTRGMMAVFAATALAGTALISVPAATAATGKLDLLPKSGTGDQAFSVVTSGGCADPRATHFYIKMRGAGLAEELNLNGVQPVTAIPASPTQTSSMTITVSKIFDVVKQENGGKLPSGVYTIDVICRAQMSTAAISTFTGQVTITDAGRTLRWESGAVAPKAMTNTKKSTVVGQARVGANLRIKAGTWNPKPDRITYRWAIGKKVVSTKATYKVGTKDRGKNITITVTPVKAGFTAKPEVLRVRIAK